MPIVSFDPPSVLASDVVWDQFAARVEETIEALPESERAAARQQLAAALEERARAPKLAFKS